MITTRKTLMGWPLALHGQTHHLGLPAGHAHQAVGPVELNAALDFDRRRVLATDHDVGAPVGQVDGDRGHRVLVRLVLDLQPSHRLDEGHLLIGLEH